MTIVDTLEYLRDWIQENVCTKLKFKAPDDSYTDDEYPYKLVHPHCFAFFMPTTDKLPPEVAYENPCVVVQIVTGSDELMNYDRQAHIRIWISVWDPGLHGKDILLPGPVDGTYTQWVTKRSEQSFYRNAEGWRDAWNFIDTLLREMEAAEYMNGVRLCTEQAITWGPLQEADSNIIDAYPYYLAWVELTVSTPLARKVPDSYSKYL